jgi:glutaconate CoA-transferase, subunit A
MSDQAGSRGRQGRRPVVETEGEAGARVRDGMTIAVGGFINTGHPMAVVRQVIRKRVRDLTVVGAASAGMDVDLLIAAGCARRVIAPYVGAEGLAPIGPAFQAAAQAGEIEVWELDEAMYYAGLRAAAQGLPFNPWRAGVGTSYPEVNPDLVEFEDPVQGERLLAIPAIEVDVALLHAARSDAFGNVQHEGSGYGDRAIYAAAGITVVSVERLVSVEEIRRNPAATTVPGADAIVRAPFGAHPFSSHGHYPVDVPALQEYVSAARPLRQGDRGPLERYLERYVYEPETHFDYLERVGLKRLLALSEY